jgi:hypothetical protein
VLLFAAWQVYLQKTGDSSSEAFKKNPKNLVDEIASGRAFQKNPLLADNGYSS